MVVELYRGTNIKNGKKIIEGEYNNISWWSNNYETVDHYYEGCILQLQIELTGDEDEYVHTENESFDYNNYTYGCVEVFYPESAIWYSFSANYIKSHCISIKEISFDELKNKLLYQEVTI